MTKKTIIEKKLLEIFTQLKHLEEILPVSEKELFTNSHNLYFAERVMERLITSAIDINMHIASDDLNEHPENYFQSFLALTKLKIYPKPFAERIALSGSLKNILAHSYQDLDGAKFIKAMKLALVDYKKFAGYVQRYLERG